MAIFLTKDSKVLVRGMTGGEGMKHTRRMLAAGTDVVGGVNPRKPGRSVDVDGTRLPVFGSVAEGMAATGADVTVLFVPPPFVRGAVTEAADAGVRLAVVITEGVPVHDAVRLRAYADMRGTWVIGPNCPGLISPGQSNAGIIPAGIAPAPGRIGLVSKSGTLTYQLMRELRGIGFSSAVGIGGDPVVGTSHIDCLAAFERDPDTELVRPHRRDRRRRGGARGGVHRRPREQTGRRVHRRVHGAPGPDDGPRGSHRLRLLGPRGPRRRRWSRPGCTSARPRRRRRAWCAPWSDRPCGSGAARPPGDCRAGEAGATRRPKATEATSPTGGRRGAAAAAGVGGGGRAGAVRRPRRRPGAGCVPFVGGPDTGADIATAVADLGRGVLEQEGLNTRGVWHSSDREPPRPPPEALTRRASPRRPATHRAPRPAATSDHRI